MSEKGASIYALVDPMDNRIRYVGASHRPRARYHQHLQSASSCRLGEWIAGLRERCERPLMLILEEVSAEERQEKEQLWIVALLLRGEPLLNHHLRYIARYSGRERARCRVDWATLWAPHQRQRQRRWARMGVNFVRWAHLAPGPAEAEGGG